MLYHIFIQIFELQSCQLTNFFEFHFIDKNNGKFYAIILI